MDIPVIETRALDFSYSPTAGKTLDNVNLQVMPGSIYGFLGPNGAGKTTTLRLLLGLLKNQSGSILLFGRELSHQRIEILRRLGSLIEQPSLYLHLTAKENLEIYRLIYNCEKSRIAEVLEIVGLENTGRKKAKQFSLGMKQRLSIAIALLHNPDLLILDEPTNGLDPNGIIETRELIKKLNKTYHTTILVSSHILSEVEKMATHVGIIHKGRLLFQGAMQELQQMKSQQAVLEVETNHPESAISLLSAQFEVQQKEDTLLLPFRDRLQAAAVNRLLVENGFDVYALRTRQSDLEQIFIDITSNDQ